MTKKQAAIERKAQWNQAIAEGRIVRIDMGGSLTHTFYPTVEGAQKALADATDEGLDASIVDPQLAEI